jgi:hypothetical protein
MVKKFLLVLALAGVLVGGVWAQNAPWGGKKHFISADLGLLVGGARLEMFTSPQLPKLSVGLNAYWANSFFLFNELEAGAFIRYYLFGGLFGEMGSGFHIHTGEENYQVETVGGTYSESGVVASYGLSISPGVGWKFDPGNPGGFFVEPGISVPVTVALQKSIGKKDYGYSGTSVGFILYVGLGWAF